MSPTAGPVGRPGTYGADGTSFWAADPRGMQQYAGTLEIRAVSRDGVDLGTIVVTGEYLRLTEGPVIDQELHSGTRLSFEIDGIHRARFVQPDAAP